MKEGQTHINIFGGPGTGKSTVSAGLFHKMKIQGYKVELVTEYAKDLTYGKDFTKLKDQLLIFANQFHKTFKLQDFDIDYIIHESPLLLSLIYFTPNNILDEDKFTQLVLSICNTNNINIFLKRNDKNEFQSFGRNQNLKESQEIDDKILKVLKKNNIPFVIIKSTKKSHKKILKLIKERNEKDR